MLEKDRSRVERYLQEWGDFVLDENEPHIHLRSSTTKNGQTQKIPL